MCFLSKKSVLPVLDFHVSDRLLFIMFSFHFLEASWAEMPATKNAGVLHQASARQEFGYSLFRRSKTRAPINASPFVRTYNANINVG
jgi:hypothetical protein